jgi:16S rRNA processing protein RimM
VSDDSRWVPLAQVARPHGVRGELRLNLFNPTSDTLLQQDEVLVRMPDGEEHEVSVDAARRADRAILLKLHSVDDRDRAEALRGATICVRRSELPALEEGEFYTADVEGAEVRLRDGDAERRVGAVERVDEYPAAMVLVVKLDAGGHVEVPLTNAFVQSVDTTAGVVVLSTLEGLEG